MGKENQQKQRNEEEREKYILIKQNTVTNGMTKTGAKAVKAITKNNDWERPYPDKRIKLTQIDDRKRVNEKSAVFAMVYQNVEVSVKNYDVLLEATKGRGIRPSIWATSDIITLYAQENGWNQPGYTMPLKYYMDMRGLKDAKWADQELQADLSTLAEITVREFSKSKTGKKKEVAAGGILEYRKIEGARKYYFRFGEIFWNRLLKDGYVMPVPTALYTMNYKNYPHAYFIGRKFYELFNINVGRKNTKGETTGHNPYIVGVDTLMDACPDLPRIEEVQSKGHHIKQRIVEPFMDNIAALKKWGGIGEYIICPENPKIETIRKPGGVSKTIIKNGFTEENGYTEQKVSDMLYYELTLDQIRKLNVYIEPAEGYPDPTEWRKKSLEETKKREAKARRDEAIKLRAEGKEAAKIKAKEEKKKKNR